ncbi:MAG: hypothetical protein AB8G86_10590 [Saprospiraceae bacterium]
MSQRKFGGQPEDYDQVHAFIDSSKYFYYHAKHRMLLHHLYGVSLATELCGNFLTNSDGQTLLVRDIAIEHCREDLDGHVFAAPSLGKYRFSVVCSKLECPTLDG